MSRRRPRKASGATMPRLATVAVTLCLLCVAALIGAGATAARTVAPAQECPQTAGDTCCGPPVATPSGDSGSECPGPVIPNNPVNPALTIMTSANPSAAGSGVTVYGTLGDGANQSVTLWQEAAGADSFTQLASMVTDSSGVYTFRLPAGSITTYRSWYVTGGTEQSQIIFQQVRAEVTAAPSARTVRAGGTVRVSGAVSPSHKGERVLIVQRVAGQETVVGRATLSGQSKYAAQIRMKHAGRASLYVELPADGINTVSFSPVISVKVTPHH